MQMCHCDHDECLIVKAVDQPVRESTQKTASQSRADFLKGEWICGRPANRAVNLIDKIPAETGAWQEYQGKASLSSRRASGGKRTFMDADISS